MDEYLNPCESKDFLPTFYFKPVVTDYRTKMKNLKNITCYLEPKINPCSNESQLVEDSTVKHCARGPILNPAYFKMRDEILDQLLAGLEKHDQDINLLKDQYQHLKRENRRLRLLLYFNSISSDLETKPDDLVEVSTDQPYQDKKVSKHPYINNLKQTNRDFSFYEETRRVKHGLTLVAERIQHYRLDPTESRTVERRITTGECPQKKLTCMNNGHTNHELIRVQNNHPLPTENLNSVRPTNTSDICTRCEEYNNRPRLIGNKKELKNDKDALQDFQLFYNTPEQHSMNSSKPTPSNDKREVHYQQKKINIDHKNKNAGNGEMASQSSIGTWEGGNTPQLESVENKVVLETLPIEPNPPPVQQNSKVSYTNSTTATDEMNHSTNFMCSERSFNVDKENSNQSLDGLKPKHLLPVYSSEFKSDIDLRLLKNTQLPQNYNVNLRYIKNNEIDRQRIRLQTSEKIHKPRPSNDKHSSYQSATRGVLDGWLTDLPIDKPNNSNFNCQETPNTGAEYLKIHRTRTEQGRLQNSLNRRKHQTFFKRKLAGNGRLGNTTSGINRLNTPAKDSFSRTYSVWPHRKRHEKVKNQIEKQKDEFYGTDKVEPTVESISTSTEKQPLVRYKDISSQHISENNLPNRLPVIINSTVKEKSFFYKSSQSKSMPSETSLLLAKPGGTEGSGGNRSIANSDLKYPETEGCCIM